MQEKSNSFRQEGNQLIHTRLLDAPRELVWEVWTQPEHLKKWWGPDGFTITNHSMEVQPGKYWRFIMHGDGMNYDNKVQYLEVVEPSLLVYQHGDEQDTISFKVYVSFEEVDGKTLLTMRSVFASEELIAELNRKVNATERGKETLNKMEKYIREQIQKQQG
ncbi:SRPBCC domain-containing protein [Chitinophaga barathri]|uniref:ATPase n=1 Tax=Chitinophaga barathri TaxID=1647451 RepID=A0A3N4M4P1_9BACT|nr:SRPBCC domain-containing protein [Chitinophaga barathri]RPD38082.1 ATPase [Chitinophaga barathri]